MRRVNYTLVLHALRTQGVGAGPLSPAETLAGKEYPLLWWRPGLQACVLWGMFPKKQNRIEAWDQKITQDLLLQFCPSLTSETRKAEQGQGSEVEQWSDIYSNQQ